MKCNACRTEVGVLLYIDLVNLQTDEIETIGICLGCLSELAHPVLDQETGEVVHPAEIHPLLKHLRPTEEE